VSLIEDHYRVLTLWCHSLKIIIRCSHCGVAHLRSLLGAHIVVSLIEDRYRVLTLWCHSLKIVIGCSHCGVTHWRSL